MFSWEPNLEPSCDYYKEYVVPERIEEVCKDILARGERTQYAEIYDAIFELVDQDFLQEAMHA